MGRKHTGSLAGSPEDAAKLQDDVEGVQEVPTVRAIRGVRFARGRFATGVSYVFGWDDAVVETLLDWECEGWAWFV